MLAWSTNYHDGTAPSKFQKMNDEDRAFLENAMQAAFAHIEDPNEAVHEALCQIRKEDRTDESICTALEVIDRLCDDPDVARNIDKLDGIQTLFDLTGSHGGCIRPRTCEFLALLFSNNPNIQEAGIARGGMQLFLKMVREAPKGSDDRSKAFRALVALVRHLPKHEETLMRSEGGLNLLVELLDLGEEARTREKVASFVVSLASNGNLRVEEAETLVAAVVPLLSGAGAEGVQYRELLSSCCLELAKIAPQSSLAVLGDAAQGRLSAISAAGPADDGDEGAELAALQECLDVLGGRKA